MSSAEAFDLARARLFALLARVLDAPPDRPLLDMLGALPGDATPVGEALGALADAALRADPDALEREFFALFVGVGRGELLPYASWYRTGFLHERPLADLRHELGLLGIARAAAVQEPEDHIAFLCDVMAGLLEGRFDGEPTTFFASHVAPWAGRCFADLERAATSPFYRAVGTLGRTVIDIEQTAMELAA